MTTKRDLVVWSLLGLGALAVAALALLRILAPPPEPLPVYAELPEFSLTNRDGGTVTLADLSGAPWIADFIFTRCAGICPFMTRQMGRIAGELPAGEGLHLVSITADPEHDTPDVLAAYAERHGAPDFWYFLTGPGDAIRTLSRDGFLLGLEPASEDAPGAQAEPIVHSNRFVLGDAAGRSRGYYDGFDEIGVQRLLADLETLLGEHE